MNFPHAQGHRTPQTLTMLTRSGPFELRVQNNETSRRHVVERPRPYTVLASNSVERTVTHRHRQLHMYTSRPHDHLHNYGPGTRFGASQARFGCVVCVSHSSFRFSSALECRSAITVVFLAFSIEAGLVLHSSLMVFHGQVSSIRKRWLLAIRQADWSHFRVPNNTVVCIEHVLPAKNFRFHARA